MRAYQVILLTVCVIALLAAGYWEQHHASAQAPQHQIEAFALNGLDGEATLKILKAAFGDDVRVAIDQGGKVIVARGPKHELRALGNVLKALGAQRTTNPAESTPRFTQPAPPAQPTPQYRQAVPQSPFRAEPYRKPHIPYGEPARPAPPGTPIYPAPPAQQARPPITQPAPHAYSYPRAINAQPKDPRAIEATKKYNQLEAQILALAQQYRKLESADKEAELRERIVSLTEEQFALRQSVRKLEVERIKKRLEEVEGNVNRREELKEQIIARRVAELLQEDKELRWEPLGYRGGGQQYWVAETVVETKRLPDGTTRQEPKTIRRAVTAPTHNNAPPLSTGRPPATYLPETIVTRVEQPDGTVREVQSQVLRPGPITDPTATPPAETNAPLLPDDDSGAGIRGKFDWRNLHEYKGTTLRLSGTDVNDRSLNQLGKLKNLEELYLRDTSITDMTLEQIAQLPKLDTLSLAGAAVTDSGIRKLKELGSLRRIILDKTQVTSDGVRDLIAGKPILCLSVTGTAVDDSLLDALRESGEHLKFLMIDDTQVTRDAVTRFRKHLPACRIQYAELDQVFGANTPYAGQVELPSPPPTPPASPLTVVEAQARLRIAQTQLERTKSLVKKGYQSDTERLNAQQRVESAQRALTQAQREYAANKKLLELDLRKAQLDVEAAVNEFSELEEVGKRSPGSIPRTQLRSKRLGVQRLELELQKAQTLLDLHKKSGIQEEPQAEPRTESQPNTQQPASANPQPDDIEPED